MDNKEATRRAISSLKISGFDFDQEAEKIWAKVSSGELTTDDARLLLFEKIEKLKIEHPEWFTEPDE